MDWKTIAWCEIDEFNQKILKYHFPYSDGYGDIKKTSFEKYKSDTNRIILTGGFPCQPYSHCGKRLGKEDDRHLWPEMLRAIKEIQPNWIVGENVFGIVNWNDGMVFNEVQSDLETQGYKVLPFLLPACAINAPHRRDRIWFIAYSDGSSKRNNTGTNNREKKEIWQREKSNVLTESISNEFASLPRGYEGNYEDFKFERFPTKSPVCRRNDGLPFWMDRDAFSEWREKSLKSYGNAIVPQVAYNIFKVIEKIEKNIK